MVFITTCDLLILKLHRVLSRVHKLELQRPCLTLLQRVRRDEAGTHGLGGIKLSCGAELLDADGGDGQFFEGDKSGLSI